MSTDETQKPIIILSGPMSGLPDYNYHAFNLAAEQLREYGYEVVNPAEHNRPIGSTWGDYVGRCLDVMRMVHDNGRPCMVASLQGWGGSSGAVVEHALATYYGWQVMPYTDILRDIYNEATKGQAA